MNPWVIVAVLGGYLVVSLVVAVVGDSQVRAAALFLVSVPAWLALMAVFIVTERIPRFRLRRLRLAQAEHLAGGMRSGAWLVSAGNRCIVLMRHRSTYADGQPPGDTAA